MIYISVIIPTLNRYSDLKNTINDLLLQDFEDFEIIIIDQSSNSKDLFNNIPKVRYFYQKELSASKARNKGIIESNGEILLFLDDDVIIENKSFLRIYYTRYNSTKVPGIVGGVLENRQELKMTRHWMSRLKKTGWLFFPQNYGHETFVDVGRSCNLSVRKEYALEVGGMDENFDKGAHREEADFCIRIKKRYGSFLYLPEATLFHIGAPNGGIRNWGGRTAVKAQHHFDGAIYFLFKNVSIFHFLPHMLSMYLFFFHKNISITKPHFFFISIFRMIKAIFFSIRKLSKGPKYLNKDLS